MCDGPSDKPRQGFSCSPQLRPSPLLRGARPPRRTISWARWALRTPLVALLLALTWRRLLTMSFRAAPRSQTGFHTTSGQCLIGLRLLGAGLGPRGGWWRMPSRRGSSYHPRPWHSAPRRHYAGTSWASDEMDLRLGPLAPPTGRSPGRLEGLEPTAAGTWCQLLATCLPCTTWNPRSVSGDPRPKDGALDGIPCPLASCATSSRVPALRLDLALR